MCAGMKTREEGKADNVAQVYYFYSYGTAAWLGKLIKHDCLYLDPTETQPHKPRLLLRRRP
jgi:hypothetical protein